MSEVKKVKTADMLEGSIFKTLLFFGIPIFLGNLFQQFYNMVDSIVVGRFVGPDALAAVGASGTITMVLIGIMIGFPTGGSVVAAQYIGAGKKSEIKAVVSTALILMLIIAVFLMVVGIPLAPVILRATEIPEEIMPQSVAYFRIFLIGMIFMALYNFFAAFLRTFGDSKTPLYFLIFSSLLNIVGDLFFVIILHMGVSGVAIATVIAQGVSVVTCYFYCSRRFDYFSFSRGEFVYDKAFAKQIIRIGVPSSLQMSVTGFGMVLVQRLINTYGTISMAAYTAASKMENVCGLPMMGISMGVSIMVGQNIGAGNKERTKKALSVGIFLCVILCLCTSVLVLIFGKYIMMLFVKSEEMSVIETGVKFMRRLAAFLCIRGASTCLTSFLRGAGDAMSSMFANFVALGARLAFAYLFAKALSLGFLGIAFSVPCGWGVQLLFVIAVYFSGRWKKKAVIVKGAESE
ncbi:MAG: MATE family efflux transporter [Oscillospiraceae bacterium]|nr:MATE family efflux transporter [Oscillospiraceae bacterium]